MNELTRNEKLKVLQDSFSLWEKLYPQEKDDEPGNHLFEIQEKALAEALARKLKNGTI